MTGPIIRLAAIGFLAAAVASPAMSASMTVAGGVNTSLFLNLLLGCSITQEKVIAITNTTGGDLAGGTLSYDYVRRGDGAHFGASYPNIAIGAGATLKRGIEPALSCTASYRKPPPKMQMAP